MFIFIRDDGAKIFADMTLTNRVLKVLNISNNNIGDTGASYFAQIIGLNFTLTELYFDNDRLTVSGTNCGSE